MRKQTVNLWAVLVCVVLGQVIPALWYSAFSDTWMSLNGFTAEEVKGSNSPVPYLASIVSTSFTAYLMGWIFTKIPVRSSLTGFITGLIFGLVFVLGETIVKDMFSMKPLMLSLINGGVSVIVYAVTGAILGVWRQYG
jgi:hypothetical protein